MPTAWAHGLSLKPFTVSLAIVGGPHVTPPSSDRYTVMRDPPPERLKAMHTKYATSFASTMTTGSPSASQPGRWNSQFVDQVVPPSVE